MAAQGGRRGRSPTRGRRRPSSRRRSAARRDRAFRGRRGRPRTLAARPSDDAYAGGPACGRSSPRSTLAAAVTPPRASRGGLPGRRPRRRGSPAAKKTRSSTPGRRNRTNHAPEIAPARSPPAPPPTTTHLPRRPGHRLRLRLRLPRRRLRVTSPRRPPEERALATEPCAGGERTTTGAATLAPRESDRATAASPRPSPYHTGESFSRPFF
mmetsp:Transcript_20770/g.66846  ORF Transcript_20770/g.66846 Transcript_20770/m.66846 type:complete len:211 (-) Transcript_20770:6-638(-)